jgi:hypothetical protein
MLAQNFPEPAKAIIVTNFFDLFTHCLSTIKDEMEADSKKVEGELEAPKLVKTVSTAGLDWNEIFKTVIENWKRHTSTETTEISKDNILWSTVRLVKKMLVLFKDTHSYDEFIEFVTEMELLNEIFLENLFYIPGMTKNENQNKCKGKDSRTLCY